MGEHVTELGVQMRKQELRAEAAERAMKLSLMQRDLIDTADKLERDPDVLEATGESHTDIYSGKLDNYAQGVIDSTEDALLRDEFFKVYDQLGVKYRARARSEAHAKRVDHISTGLITLEEKLIESANVNNYKQHAVELTAAYNAVVSAGMLTEKYAETRNNVWADAVATKIENTEEHFAWKNAAADPESFLAHTDWAVDKDDRWVKGSKEEGLTANGEPLVNHKDHDKATYDAFGKEGYTWIYKKDPDQILRIRAWAMSKMKARGQGSTNSTSMIDFKKKSDLSSRSENGPDKGYKEDGKPFDVAAAYRAIGTESANTKAEIYERVEKPMAEHFYTVTHTNHESLLVNDDKSAFRVEFQFLPQDKKMEILKKEIKPKASAFGHHVAEAMYENMERSVEMQHAAAVKDPAGFTAGAVAKEVEAGRFDNELAPPAIDYSLKLQSSMQIQNRKILSKGFKAQFKEAFDKSNADQKLARLTDLKNRVGKHWPQVIKEAEMSTMAMIAASGDLPLEEAREVLRLDSMEEKEIPLGDEKDKKSIKDTLNARFHDGDLGRAITGQIGVHMGLDRDRSTQQLDNLRSNMYKMAMMERMKGTGIGASVQKAIDYFQNKNSYLVEDDAYYLVLPRGEDSLLIKDGLTYARTNLVAKEADWKETLVKYMPDEYADVLAEGHIDYVRRAGVWVNVASSENRLFMLVDKQTGLPILRTNRSLYTVDITKAKELGKTLRDEVSEWERTAIMEAGA
jgi:hypothetical protein